MEKFGAAQHSHKASFIATTNVSGKLAVPITTADEDKALAEPRAGSLLQPPSNAAQEDVLQVFDNESSTLWQTSGDTGNLAGVLTFEANASEARREPGNVVPLGDYQRNASEQRHESADFVRQTQVYGQPRQVVGQYIAPPTNPSQRHQTRSATAKLDYYKKLAELQQMNLEFGRSIRTARNEPRPDARAEARAEMRSESTHPLTTSFHVATKRAEARVVTPASAKQPTLHSLPADPQRVTAKLDYNRLLEFQRRLDETQADGPTIEDRLSKRLLNEGPAANPFVVETVRPRLPVREWQTAPPAEASATREAGLLGQGLDPRATGSLQRSTFEQLEAQLRQQPALERIREVLLDPTRIDPHLIALSDFNPRAAKYFDQVAVSLISVSYKRLCKRVLVASAQHGEGRTCVALNLAGALARARQRVLVVDCDLANPSVLRLLGIDAPLGLSEAVHRGLGPNSAALRVQPASFNILPTREKIQHSAELLASPRFHEMLQICEPDYDFILFDSSPLLESADANLLAGLTDATMLVIRPGMTTTQQMARAVALFNEKDLCGVVLNRVAG